MGRRRRRLSWLGLLALIFAERRMGRWGPGYRRGYGRGFRRGYGYEYDMGRPPLWREFARRLYLRRMGYYSMPLIALRLGMRLMRRFGFSRYGRV